MGQDRQQLGCHLTLGNRPTRKVCLGFAGTFSTTGVQLGLTLKHLPVASLGRQTEIVARSLKLFAIVVPWILDGVGKVVSERVLE